MRALTLALFVLGAAGPRAAAQTPVAQRAAAAPDGAVRIQNMVGSVRVTGWDRDSIAVTGTLDRAMPRDAFAFHVASGGAKIGVWETGTKPGPSHLEVHVPAGSTVWVKTASADIRIADVTGSIDAYAVSGGIEITGAPRAVVAESLAGTVAIDVDARTVRAKSATGAITLRGASMDVTATTVGGRIAVHGAGPERGRFESVDGPIEFAGSIGPRSTLDFVSHTGGITFVVAPDAAAEFRVETYQGTLDDRVGVRAQAAGSDLKGREFRFRIGTTPAGGQVTVRTFRGTVLLRPAG